MRSSMFGSFCRPHVDRRPNRARPKPASPSQPREPAAGRTAISSVPCRSCLSPVNGRGGV
ncbi:hypothetical protein C8Q73DRAFT_98328 [Cubamyces lactineus]|nr:hypothetical protein C8Q73DRAFT_98328 [Cubamyces lactineus]